MKIFIILLLSVFLFSCTSDCIHENSAIVTKVEDVIYDTGKVGGLRSKQLVYVTYNIDETEYKKDFVSELIIYKVGEEIKIKTGEDSNVFCVID